MEKNTLIVLLIISVLATSLSGCISSDDFTVDQIKEQFISAVHNVTSYKYSVNSIGLMTSINESGTSTD